MEVRDLKPYTAAIQPRHPPFLDAQLTKSNSSTYSLDILLSVHTCKLLDAVFLIFSLTLLSRSNAYLVFSPFSRIPVSRERCMAWFIFLALSDCLLMIAMDIVIMLRGGHVPISLLLATPRRPIFQFTHSITVVRRSLCYSCPCSLCK